MKKQSNVTVVKALLVETDYIIECKWLGGVRSETENAYGGWT